MSTVISLQDVGVTYRLGRNPFRARFHQALKSVSFEIRDGESLGIIGRNGVGKSTILRVVAGIMKPDRGHVINKGVSTALLALQAGFDPNLSGRDNILINGMLLGLSRRDVRDRMADIIAFSELDQFIDQQVKTYSSGMRSRLGFSIAINMEPDVLLIDEALAVGDAEFRRKSGTVLRERIRSDQTVVLVSHNAQDIKDLCDRAVWIEEGQTRSEGGVEAVLKEYNNYIAQLTTPPPQA